MYTSLPIEELCALYATADVCLVSSIHDGLNLVSYEFIACQQARGVPLPPWNWIILGLEQVIDGFSIVRSTSTLLEVLENKC